MHAEGEGSRQVRVLCNGYLVDNLERNVVRQLIKDTIKTLPVAIVAYPRGYLVSQSSKQSTDAVNLFVEKKEADESLRNFRELVRGSCPPYTMSCTTQNSKYKTQ